MTIPLRWAMYGFIVICVLFSLGSCHLNSLLTGEISKSSLLTEERNTLAKQRTADQATLALLAKKNAVAARESASARVRLHAATASAAAWGDTPVPQEVQDALK